MPVVIFEWCFWSALWVTAICVTTDPLHKCWYLCGNYLSKYGIKVSEVYRVKMLTYLKTFSEWRQEDEIDMEFGQLYGCFGTSH